MINRQPVGSGKKWATGEMVTDSKEVFFEQVQLTPAVRDKVNSMIDSGLFLGIVMVFISGFTEFMIFLRGH